MTGDPLTDLRSLGNANRPGGFDPRVRPWASGTAANRPAPNLVRPDSFYYETDTGLAWYSNGAAWSAVGGGTLATSLPGSPADGQQVILVDSTTPPTYSWLLQWNTTVAKWLFLGGSPLRAAVATAEARANAAYGALATAGPSITLPRPGTYVVRHGARIILNTGTSNYVAMMSFSIGVAAAADADAVMAGGLGGAAAASASHHFRTHDVVVASASQALVAQYRSDTGGNATWSDRYIEATPVALT